MLTTAKRCFGACGCVLGKFPQSERCARILSSLCITQRCQGSSEIQLALEMFQLLREKEKQEEEGKGEKGRE